MYSSKNQLPIDIPIERHAWVRIRDPSTDKRKLSEESKLTLSWINTSLLPLLSSIPLNRSCQLTIQAAADAFATEDTMGIGGWVMINNATFWFSQLWKTEDLQKFLPMSKALQRYITSWEALAQLCIILTVFPKSDTRPGIINVQSDLTIQELKPILIMDSLRQRSSPSPTSASWFRSHKSSATLCSMFTISQVRKTLQLMTWVEENSPPSLRILDFARFGCHF